MDPRIKAIPNPRAQPPVYCCNCKWYSSETSTEIDPAGHSYGGNDDACNAPGNWRDIYLMPNARRDMKPQQRNKNNKCPYFEPHIPFWKNLIDFLVRPQ